LDYAKSLLSFGNGYILVVPAFSASLQAQAASANVESGATVDHDTIKRIQEKAEDLGDSPDRPIGDTGLENIKQLGKKFLKSLTSAVNRALNITQMSRTKEAIDESQNQVERGSPQSKL